MFLELDLEWRYVTRARLSNRTSILAVKIIVKSPSSTLLSNRLKRKWVWMDGIALHLFRNGLHTLTKTKISYLSHYLYSIASTDGFSFLQLRCVHLVSGTMRGELSFHRDGGIALADGGWSVSSNSQE